MHRAAAARAQLQLAVELKLVFDKAHEKTVTTPAATFNEVFPALNQVRGEAIKIGDYTDARKSKIAVSGSTVTVDDPTIRNELDTMLTELDSRANAIGAAQERLRQMMR